MPRKESDSETALPPELHAAVVREAERDADAVSVVLKALGLDSLKRLPARLLLGLGAAMRLHRWEIAGLSNHLPLSLPTAINAVRLAFQRAGEPDIELDSAIVQLWLQVTAIAVRQVAWEGPTILGGHILLHEIQHPEEEEMLVDAIARLVWAHRGHMPGGRNADKATK